MVEYIRYSIDDARAEAFEQAYSRAADSLDDSEHCERYEVSRCTEDPTQHVDRIEWGSEEGHLSGFRQSPEFRRFFEAVGAVRARHRRDASLPGDALEQSLTIERRRE
jgi:quinol monooxygenase YgiN